MKAGQLPASYSSQGILDIEADTALADARGIQDIVRRGGPKPGDYGTPSAEPETYAHPWDNPGAWELLGPELRPKFAELMRSIPVRTSAADFAAYGLRYSDDQPRDDHGRWTSGGDGGDSGDTEPADKGESNPDARLITSKTSVHDAARICQSQAAAREAALTQHYTDLATANGGHMAGLEFRLKTEGSLENKINIAIHDSGGTLTPDDVVASDTWDVNRYTQLQPEDHYQAGAQATIDQLRAEGNTVTIKNAWNDPAEFGGIYRGINAKVTAPDGSRSELQFHTQASLDVKEGISHPIYDAHKDGSDMTDAELTKLTAAWGSVPVPPGAGLVR